MKKFHVIFTDSKSGLDLYKNFVVEDTRMGRVADDCDRLGAHYRLIEDVTALYPPNFVFSPWNTIPLRAFDNYQTQTIINYDKSGTRTPEGTMSKKYTVDFYIKKFSAIPRRLWRCDGHYGKPGEPMCALGHCGVGDGCTSTEQSNGLYAVLADAPGIGVTSINDRPSETFPQKTPKGRILAALRFAKNL